MVRSVVSRVLFWTDRQQGATKLLKLINKYLLMTTFEYGDNYSIQNDHKNTIRSALAPLPHTR